MNISIIIVNYKNKGFTLNCIKSIKDADWTISSPPLQFGGQVSPGEERLKYEIIVVDNNSDDAIGEILAWQNPEVKFIQSGKNLGMGAGNNIGIKKAQGKYIVVMNPDTIAFGDTFKVLYNYMEANKDVGMAGPLQFNPDKTIQDSCFRWFSFFTPLFRRTPLGKLNIGKKDLDRFLMKDFNKSHTKEVDWLLGSFLFCRAEALKQAGLFDERFFLYFEDTDLCQRFWQKNWKVTFNPNAKIIHNHTRLSARTPWYKPFGNSASRHHIVSWVKYLKKWGI